MDHVPRGASVQWSEALTDVIDGFAATPSLGSYILVSLLPKVVLGDIGRGGKRAKHQVSKVCLQRLRQFAAADYKPKTSTNSGGMGENAGGCYAPWRTGESQKPPKR